MFCPNCGKEVQSDQRFCDHCGNPLQGPPDYRQSPARASRPGVSPFLKGAILVSGAVAFLALAAIAAYFFLFRFTTPVSPQTNGEGSSKDGSESILHNEEPTLTPSLTITASITPSPTFTLTPTITLTPTPEEVRVSVSANTNCRSGPGSNYDLEAQLLIDESAIVVGKNVPLNYWVIIEPSYNVECWLWGQYAVLEGDPTLVPEMTPPPSPTPKLLPQACDNVPHYGPIQVGTTVILGKHREVNGFDNWAADMNAFVGVTTKVTHLNGVDPSGCTVVQVAADNGNYVWRVRDMKLP